jgi:hypothetical protein
MTRLLTFAAGVAVGLGLACCCRCRTSDRSGPRRRPEYVPPGERRPTGAEFAQEVPPDLTPEGGPEQTSEPRPSAMAPHPPPIS